ncbi:hypothetical protein DSO57_1008806 [Entomophthora muscae]|uniref:Uncharacterized protein n=1 Tax=Entomophthora muscae TaxID=34485 RepID=A0ACC2USV6_9FUNG|nr:hypothetical protein DSO57_1008806 [Entomophthora muscae]
MTLVLTIKHEGVNHQIYPNSVDQLLRNHVFVHITKTLDEKKKLKAINWESCQTDNFLPLKTWAQGQDLNPEPKFLRAAGPMNQEPAHLLFSEIEPMQAEAPAKSQSQNTSTL